MYTFKNKAYLGVQILIRFILKQISQYFKKLKKLASENF